MKNNSGKLDAMPALASLEGAALAGVEGGWFDITESTLDVKQNKNVEVEDKSEIDVYNNGNKKNKHMVIDNGTMPPATSDEAPTDPTA